jgi:C4-dicarboxylate transporter DctM subunit
MSPISALLLFIFSFVFFTILLKIPVSFGLGIAALLVIALNSLPILSFAQAAFYSIDSFAFLAVPFYIFAGTLMEYSGISRLLIRWIESLVGRIRGTTGAITVLACMAFGVLTGSAMATISAIGKIMVPEMIDRGYRKSYAAAITAASSFLGILIPPSIPGIMYALSAGVKISEVWMATIGPAFVFGIGYIFVNYMIRGRREEKNTTPFILKEYAANVGKSTINAIPALLMPIIIYGSIYGGICTPTEAGALSAVYGLAYFFIRKLSNKSAIKISIWKLTAISASATAVIGLLNVFAVASGRAITLSGVSGWLANYVIENVSSRGMFLLVINIIFLFLGTFLDINAAILIMTPLLLPSARALGIDAIHFGAIILINMCVGFMTPPFAAGIFVATKIAGSRFSDTVKDCLPYLAVGLVAIIITTVFPSYVMFFAKLFG